MSSEKLAIKQGEKENERMSREKQIEELAKVIGDADQKCYEIEDCNDCSFHHIELGLCKEISIADALYNAGYRKQSEGENISQMHPSDEFICEKCGLIIRDCCRYEIDEDEGDEICYEFPYQFCPRCGMKVKGGEG